jgi:hypothetical protein
MRGKPKMSKEGLQISKEGSPYNGKLKPKQAF